MQLLGLLLWGRQRNHYVSTLTAIMSVSECVTYDVLFVSFLLLVYLNLFIHVCIQNYLFFISLLAHRGNRCYHCGVMCGGSRVAVYYCRCHVQTNEEKDIYWNSWLQSSRYSWYVERKEEKKRGNEERRKRGREEEEGGEKQGNTLNSHWRSFFYSEIQFDPAITKIHEGKLLQNFPWIFIVYVFYLDDIEFKETIGTGGQGEVVKAVYKVCKKIMK